MRKDVLFLVICVALIAFSAGMARGIETDFGKVDVRTVRFTTPDGYGMAAKLYRHKAATPDNPMPGVLALHGYQNDKETAAAGAIELARRGFVVLAIDHLGHGDSDGYLDWQTASGANTGYLYLKSLPFVDASNLGIMGHSMGAMNTVILGTLNPDHRALNPQCGPPGSPELHNLLLTQARYEEFRIFREEQLTVEPLKNHPNRIEAFGLESGPVEWNVTYGDFEDGTARQAALVNTVHPGVTHSSVAVSKMLWWMQQALKGGQVDAYWIPEDNLIFLWKEILTFTAMLVSLVSMIPLTNILLGTKFFAAVAGPLPDRYAATGSDWWKLAVVNIVIAGVTYPPLTALGGIGGKIRPLVPFLKLEMTNGAVAWFLANAIINAVLLYFWYRKNHKERGITMYDLGVSFDKEKTVLDWQAIGKTALVAVILFSWLYTLVEISQWLWGIEFRFLWPFMRQFSPRRFGYFWIYLILSLPFFLFNLGTFLFGQARQREYETSAKTQVIWWLKNCVNGLLGLVIVWLVQYLPYFLNIGPGFEVMGLPQYSQMWPLMLFIFVPEYIVLFFFMTWFYRRTGKIYLGALMGASLAMWFSVAGTVIAP